MSTGTCNRAPLAPDRPLDLLLRPDTCPPSQPRPRLYQTGMQDKSAIPFQHWSLKVGRQDRDTGRAVAPFGEIASAVDDLHQSITNIILTPLGAVPTEPEKGCDLFPWLDRARDEAIPNVGRAI